MEDLSDLRQNAESALTEREKAENRAGRDRTPQRELELYQIEVEMQLEELQRERRFREKQLRKWETLSKGHVAFFEQSPLAQVVMAENYRVLHVNKSALEALGNSLTSVIEKPLTAFLTDDSVMDFHRCLRGLEVGAGSRSLRCRFLTDSDEAVEIDVELKSVTVGKNEERILAVLRPVSEGSTAPAAGDESLDERLGRSMMRLKSILGPSVALRLEPGAERRRPQSSDLELDHLLDELARRTSLLLPEGGRFEIGTRVKNENLVALRVVYASTNPEVAVRRSPSSLHLVSLKDRIDELGGWFVAASEVGSVRFEIFLPMA